MAIREDAQNENVEDRRMAFYWLKSPTRRIVAALLLAGGIGCFVWGAHLSYQNIAPQQARIQKRNDFIRKRLKARRSGN
jgi:hypothetical protein